GIDLQPRRVRPIKRIAHHYRHPGERPDRHIGALRKGETVQQPIIENVEMRRELQIRFVDIAQAGGGAFGNKRTDPVRVRITQRARAEGGNMNSHRPRVRFSPPLSHRQSYGGPWRRPARPAGKRAVLLHSRSRRWRGNFESTDSVSAPKSDAT